MCIYYSKIDLQEIANVSEITLSVPEIFGQILTTNYHLKKRGHL